MTKKPNGSSGKPVKVSLENIDRRLKRIERMLVRTIPELKKEADSIMKDERLIKEEEIRIEEEEQHIEQEMKHLGEKESQLKDAEAVLLKQLGEQVPLKFSDIVDWKNLVWDKCRFKETKEGAKTFDYFCTTLKGLCRFETCPMNR